MILFGITGLLSHVDRISTLTSILVLVMGIIAIALAIFALNEPLYIAVIIGVVLILEGVSLMLSD